jgi:hypothetical protein
VLHCHGASSRWTVRFVMLFRAITPFVHNVPA